MSWRMLRRFPEVFDILFDAHDGSPEHLGYRKGDDAEGLDAGTLKRTSLIQLSVENAPDLVKAIVAQTCGDFDDVPPPQNKLAMVIASDDNRVKVVWGYDFGTVSLATYEAIS